MDNLSQDQINNKIMDKVKQLVEISKEIADLDKVIGDVFLMNILNSMDIIQSSANSQELDISEKIKVMSNLLGIDLEVFIAKLIEDKYTPTQNGELIKNEEIQEEVLDFIINNSKDIDDYEKFLKDNSIKENLDYLKENI